MTTPIEKAKLKFYETYANVYPNVDNLWNYKVLPYLKIALQEQAKEIISPFEAKAKRDGDAYLLNVVENQKEKHIKSNE